MQKFPEMLYDPISGRLWREAGCLTPAGYRQVQFQGKQHMEHRVIWYLYYGEWPNLPIDHINGVKNDNRITNLRLATCSENLRNRSKPRNNKSGYKGVSWIKKYQAWQATIKYNGKNKYLGRFTTREDAAEAYQKAAVQYHGEFARLDI